MTSKRRERQISRNDTNNDTETQRPSGKYINILLMRFSRRPTDSTVCMLWGLLCEGQKSEVHLKDDDDPWFYPHSVLLEQTRSRFETLMKQMSDDKLRIRFFNQFYCFIILISYRILYFSSLLLLCYVFNAFTLLPFYWILSLFCCCETLCDYVLKGAIQITCIIIIIVIV